MARKKAIEIPTSGLVFTPETIDDAFSRAKSLLTQSHTKKHKITNLYVSDALIALQMIQNTLSEKYDIYKK